MVEEYLFTIYIESLLYILYHNGISFGFDAVAGFIHMHGRRSIHHCEGRIKAV